MPKIFRKIVHACGHCPIFESNYELIHGIAMVENVCTAHNRKPVEDATTIPDWCPLPDFEE